jgi:hypothetical protein
MRNDERFFYMLEYATSRRRLQPTGERMIDWNLLDRFDLGLHGDRHERELWPLVSGYFPSYEILWRHLIVPLTFRIDRQAAVGTAQGWIRFRPGIPKKYQQAAMAHYSVFYFLGRAARRISEGGRVFEYPEDIFFLLDSVGDNLKSFLSKMQDIAKDSGIALFEGWEQSPTGFDPFVEISDYRDVLLHNAVIGRGVGVDKTYIPKWTNDRSSSPLERAKSLWSEAEALPHEALTTTQELFVRLIPETGELLERFWKQALAFVETRRFQDKMRQVLNLEDYFPLTEEVAIVGGVPPASGSFDCGGSDTVVVGSPRGNMVVNIHSEK